MNKDELKQHLETRRKSLSEKEFLALIIDMLRDNPSEEDRDVLRSELVVFSAFDQDHAALYWEECLSDQNPIQREFAAFQLAILASGSTSLAYQILTKYLGEAPTENEEIDIIIDRISRLFPRGTSQEQ